ncbi:MAG: ABC transporter permease [Christensenellales bacterium]|jgi:ABC-2 type transport system permease protein
MTAAKARKYGAILGVSLRSGLMYRGNVLGGLLFYALFIFVFFSLWSTIYRADGVPGYSLSQMIWYVCVTELVVFGCRSGVFAEISESIKSGAVAYELNRPYHYVFYRFFSALGGIVFSFLFYAASALALGHLFVGPLPNFRLWMLPFVLVSIGLGTVIQFFSYLCLGLSAFFLEENRAFMFIYSKLVLMLGTFIPVEFFPGWLQTVVRYLPFSYITWAPARMAVDFSWGHVASALPLQLAWATVIIALSLLLYRKGVRKVNVQGG